MQMVAYDEELKTAFQVFFPSKLSTRSVVIISIFIRHFNLNFRAFVLTVLIWFSVYSVHGTRYI